MDRDAVEQAIARARAGAGQGEMVQQAIQACMTAPQRTVQIGVCAVGIEDLEDGGKVLVIAQLNQEQIRVPLVPETVRTLHRATAPAAEEVNGH